MDPQRIHGYRTRAIKKQKGSQLLNDFVLYSLTTLACASLCSSPFWYPPFCATFNVFFFSSLHKITSCLFASKALFVVGNLIIIFLLGESKFFASKCDAYNVVCHDKYVCNPSQEHNGEKTIEDMRKQEMLVKTLESETFKCNDEEEFFEICDKEPCDADGDRMTESFGRGDTDLRCLGHIRDVSLPVEELNKLVDDFIARINRQRRFEAEFCRVL